MLKENFEYVVARRVRAWIETSALGIDFTDAQVARRVRAWIETADSGFRLHATNRRPPCAGVD